MIDRTSEDRALCKKALEQLSDADLDFLNGLTERVGSYSLCLLVRIVGYLPQNTLDDLVRYRSEVKRLDAKISQKDDAEMGLDYMEIQIERVEEFHDQLLTDAIKNLPPNRAPED